MDDDRLDDRVAAEIRARLMAQVVADRTPARASSVRPTPRRHWVLPVLTTAVVAAVVAAVSIAVLVAPHRAQPASPFEDLPRMFGGSCSAVLPGSTVQEVVGGAVGRPVDVTREQADAAGAALTPLLAIGGLRCDWSAKAAPKDQSGLVLAAAPVALAPKRPAATECFASSAGGPDQETCTFSRRTHGVWFTGSITTKAGNEAETRAQLRRLGVALVASAKEPDVAVPLPARAAKSWKRDVDCEALVRSAGLRALLAMPGLAGEPGNGLSEQPEGQTVAASRLGLTPCIAQADDGGFEFTVLPGGADVKTLVQAEPSARTIRLSGAGAVTVITDADGATAIWAFDGVNALQVLPDQLAVDRVAPAIAPLLKRLEAGRSK